jgi:hypothetical protein
MAHFRVCMTGGEAVFTDDQIVKGTCTDSPEVNSEILHVWTTFMEIAEDENRKTGHKITGFMMYVNNKRVQIEYWDPFNNSTMDQYDPDRFKQKK